MWTGYRYAIVSTASCVAFGQRAASPVSRPRTVIAPEQAEQVLAEGRRHHRRARPDVGPKRPPGAPVSGRARRRPPSAAQDLSLTWKRIGRPVGSRKPAAAAEGKP